MLHATHGTDADSIEQAGKMHLYTPDKEKFIDNMKGNTSLDFFAILWYYRHVKLGCYATIPHGFDRRLMPRNRGSPLPKRVTGTGSSCFEAKYTD